MNDRFKPRVRRRDVLRAMTVGGVAAAVGVAPLARPAIAATETKDERRKPRYRLSEEVKTFYRVNRYPR